MKQEDVLRQKTQEIIEKAGGRELELIYSFARSVTRED